MITQFSHIPFDRDPIYRLIKNQSPMAIWVASICIHIVVYIAVGLITQSIIIKLHLESRYLLISESAEIINGISIWIIFYPVCWAFFRWHPQLILETIEDLERRGIITTQKQKGKKGNESFSQLLRRVLTSKWINLLAILAATVSLCVLSYIAVPALKSNIGKISFWYFSVTSASILSILYFLANYVLFVFVFRTIIVAWGIGIFFRQPGSINQLIPLHPDKCGGIGSLGIFIGKMLLVAVVVPIYATVYAIFPILQPGGQPQWTIVFVVYILYVLIFPTALFIALWQPHKAMMYYKTKRKNIISKQLHVLSDSSIKDIESGNFKNLHARLESIKELNEIYSVLEKQIPTWPVSFSTLGNLGAIATSPIFIGIISFVFQLLK
jgi:hypothetical protein